MIERVVRALIALASASLLTACAGPGALTPGDPIRAAFVVLGEGGSSLVRVITTDPACPPLDVDRTTLVMAIRAVPETMPLRPTTSQPAESKPSTFPVLVCERVLPAGAMRASVGGHTLPLLHRDARRIVVIGDTGCRVQGNGDAIQACNDAAAWPFARVAAAAAAMKPDLVIHVGDYHYRENACPDPNPGCRRSPWGYGWDTWDADFFSPAHSLLSAAPWVFVRGNHESCARAGQGWWRFLDPRPLASGRDCNDPANDFRGDYSDPYAVPLSADTQLIVFDSSRAGVAPLRADDPVYAIYSRQTLRALEFAHGAAHNFFVDHHPILGFAADTSRPHGVYPGNAALQSVLPPRNGAQLFPAGIDALLAGHNHLFEAVDFATGQPPQFISGNGGTQLDEPLPRPLPPDASVARGAVVAKITSAATFGFIILLRDAGTAAPWRVEARDRDGRLLTRCLLHERRTTCIPEDLQ